MVVHTIPLHGITPAQTSARWKSTIGETKKNEVQRKHTLVQKRRREKRPLANFLPESESGSLVGVNTTGDRKKQSHKKKRTQTHGEGTWKMTKRWDKQMIVWWFTRYHYAGSPPLRRQPNEKAQSARQKETRYNDNTPWRRNADAKNAHWYIFYLA